MLESPWDDFTSFALKSYMNFKEVQSLLYASRYLLFLMFFIPSFPFWDLSCPEFPAHFPGDVFATNPLLLQYSDTFCWSCCCPVKYQLQSALRWKAIQKKPPKVKIHKSTPKSVKGWGIHAMLFLFSNSWFLFEIILFFILPTDRG